MEDEETERLLVQVRADTGTFAQDVAEMRAALSGPLSDAADGAGRAIEAGLARAVRTGKLGFEDLRRVALSALADVARAAVMDGVVAAGAGGGLGALAGKLLGAALGLPGRATGGSVAPGRAYLVGERGPEVFVPTASGNVAPMTGGGAREVRVAISVNAPAGAAAGALRESSRQVARAVRGALERAGD